MRAIGSTLTVISDMSCIRGQGLSLLWFLSHSHSTHRPGIAVPLGTVQPSLCFVENQVLIQTESSTLYHLQQLGEKCSTQYSVTQSGICTFDWQTNMTKRGCCRVVLVPKYQLNLLSVSPEFVLTVVIEGLQLPEHFCCLVACI